MINTIIETFSNMQASTNEIIGMVVTLVSIIFVAFFKSKVFQEFLTGVMNWLFSMKDRLFKKKQADSDLYEKIKEEDLINHDLFNYLDFWLSNQIPGITLKTRYRTVVFRKYLRIYFSTYRKKVYEYVESKNYETYNSLELKKSIFDLFNDITNTMEAEMRMVGIPNVIITKMKHSLRSRNELALELTTSVCNKNIYDSPFNRMKVYSILELILPVLDNTILNIEPVCNELNGELSGLSIDGITEPISKHKKTEGDPL